MKVIYKYGLPVLEKFSIDLPAGAYIIHVLRLYLTGDLCALD